MKPPCAVLLEVDGANNGSANGITGTVSGADKQYLEIKSTNTSNGPITVYVKGGDNYNTYSFSLPNDVTGMHSPYNGGGNIPTISHYFVCGSVTQQGPSLTVYAGYADSTIHNSNPSAAMDPGNPWPPRQGAQPNVNFNGTAVDAGNGHGPDYDSGALWLHNNTASPITVTDVKVTIGTCVFDIWGNSNTVPANGDLVLAQTGGLPPQNLGGASAGCSFTNGALSANNPVPGGYNFDSSETVPSGSADECDANPSVPSVQVTASAGGGTFTDTTKALTSHGNDAGSCGNGLDPTNAFGETIPWVQIS